MNWSKRAGELLSNGVFSRGMSVGRRAGRANGSRGMSAERRNERSNGSVKCDAGRDAVTFGQKLIKKMKISDKNF